MSKSINKTMIGLFVVGAIVLIVGAIGVLGSGKFFKKQFRYFMVFEGSVKGLNVGSPMVFRGVKIGAVSGVHLYFNYISKVPTVLVYVESEQGYVIPFNVDKETAEEVMKQGQYVFFKELIERGLRAQLEMQSFVTGQLQIALDFYPDKPAVYTGIDKKVIEIPTIPTPLQELTRKLESLPLEEIFHNASSAMDAIARLIGSPELKEIIANVNAGLKDVQSLVRNVNDQVKPLSAGLSKTIQDTDRLAKNLDKQVAAIGHNLNGAITDSRDFIAKVGSGVDSVRVGALDMIKTASAALEEAAGVLNELQSASRADSMLMYRITESLREVEKSARSVRILTDYLERHPEALLRGKSEPKGD